MEVWTEGVELKKTRRFSSRALKLNHKPSRNSRVTTSSLHENSRGDVPLLSGSGKDESFAVLSRNSTASLVDEQGDSVFSEGLQELGTDGKGSLRSSDLLVEAEGEN